MLLLALDTSTRYASVALCSDDVLLSEYTWYAENNHSVDLLERIQRSISERQLSLSQLDAIAVATGPGSFNGVRVALSAAKALAFALQKPLVGIPTLDLIGAQQQWHGLVCAVLEAGRSELYAACYFSTERRLSSGEVTYELELLGDYMLCGPEQLVETLQKQQLTRASAQAEILFCGEIKSASWQAVQQGLGAQCLLSGALQSIRHASFLTRLALQRLQAGQADDPLLIEPLYLRRPSITKSTRKQPLFGGKLATTNGPYTTERE